VSVLDAAAHVADFEFQSFDLSNDVRFRVVNRAHHTSGTTPLFYRCRSIRGNEKWPAATHLYVLEFGESAKW
jgi:hypothetical protein